MTVTQLHPSGFPHGTRGHACNGEWNRTVEPGQRWTFRPDLPPVPGPWEPNLIVAPGMGVQVLATFRDWNCIPGLVILWVYVPATGQHTHIVPRDIGEEDW